jgi:hypothetical protein
MSSVALNLVYNLPFQHHLRFISHHFDEVYTSYFAFLRWRDIYLAEFPTAVVRICDWLRANVSESGNSRQSTNIEDVVADAALHLVQETY